MSIFKVLATLPASERKTYLHLLADLMRDVESQKQICVELGKHNWQVLNLDRGIRFQCSVCSIAVIDHHLADARLKTDTEVNA